LLSVLVVDDDDDIRFALKCTFEKLGCNTLEADSIESAVEVLTSGPCDAAFCDVRLPGGRSGTELLALVAEQKLETKIVMMSCAMDDEATTNLTRLGAVKCMKKPFFKAACHETLTTLFPEALAEV